jgi:hypothetical protein
MPRKPTPKRYTGILAEPRKPWGPLSLLNAEEEITRRERIHADQFLERLGLILDHYGIARNAPDWAPRLLHSLLLAHVPGFRVAPGRGAKVFWDVNRNVELVLDVQRIINTGKKASVAFHNPEIQRRYQQKDADSLRRRYEDARRNPIIAGFEAMAKHSQGRLSFAEIAEMHLAEIHLRVAAGEHDDMADFPRNEGRKRTRIE